jgi:hypothetical protein
VVCVAEAHVSALDPAESLHVHFVGRVDQDVADRGIGQQRCKRTHADRFVGQFLGEPHALGFVECNLVRCQRPRRELLHRRRHVCTFAFEQAALAYLVEEPLLQHRLDGQIISAARFGGLRGIA